MKDKTTFELAMRLNELIRMYDQFELDIINIERARHELDKEWNALCEELHRRYPALKADQDIQPKVLSRRPGERYKDV